MEENLYGSCFLGCACHGDGKSGWLSCISCIVPDEIHRNTIPGRIFMPRPIVGVLVRRHSGDEDQKTIGSRIYSTDVDPSMLFIIRR